MKINKTTILPAVLYGYETIFHITGRMMIEGVWEQGADENILT
jgi:hypothetical protein